MNCTEAEEKLNAAMDGELTVDERAGLDAHVAACADCRRLREALAEQDRDLDAAFAPLRARNDAVVERIVARPSHFRRIAAIAAAAVFVFAALYFRQPKAPIAVLARATGPVQVNGVVMPPGGTLREGDRVSTGDQTTCELSWSNGGLVRMNAATELRCPDAEQVQIEKGELFARVPAGAKPILFSADQTRITAADGAISMSRHPLSVSVVEGKARVADGQRQQEVPEFMGCQAGTNRWSAPAPADPLLETRWMHPLLKLRGKDDPELVRRITVLLAKVGPAPSPHEAEIRAFGGDALPALLAAVTAPEGVCVSADRRQAARLLSDLAGPAQRAALAALTKDPDEEIRRWAQKGLKRLADAEDSAPPPKK